MESVRLDAGGLPLHALHRAGGGPRLLFLHGWLEHAHAFDFVWEHLPGHWQLLGLDFRGHGQSGHVPPGGIYHFTDYLADIDAAVRFLGGERVHLVGHSMGGAQALLYASVASSRVASTTAIESIGPVGADAELAYVRLQEFVADLHKPARRRTYATLEQAAARVRENNSDLSEAAALHLTRFGTRPAEGGLQFTFDPRLQRRFAFTFDEPTTLEVLSQVPSPLQILHGTHGYTFDDAQMKERLRRLKDPPLIAVEGGHHIHLERPREVAEHIARFVEKSNA